MYELEVRFYDFFKSDLFVSFMKDYYKQYLTEVVENTVSICDNDLRILTYSDGTSSSVMMKKEIIREVPIPNKKFSISRETIVEPSDITKCVPKIVRKRKREIYQISENLQLHITCINGINYEVEVEREVDSIEESVIDTFIEDFESFMEDLEQHSDNFVNFLNTFNGYKDSKYEMSKKVIAKPRDFEKTDLITEKGRGIPEGYTLTIKGNGIPVIIYHTKGNAYIVSLNKFFKHLTKTNSKSLEEFMIIGEYMNESILAPFDILHWTRYNGKDVRNHPNHLERLDFIKDIIDRNKPVFGALEIYFKSFVEAGKTPESFAKAYKKVRSKDYPFEDDGLIMTPIRFPQWNPIPNPRQLSKGPEVCKIKPWKELSIDFLVNLKKHQVFTSGSKDPYTGSYKFPFSSSKHVDFKSIPKDMDGKIVELSPVKDESSETGFILKFSRHREDKTEPNYKDTVDRVWKHINDPLEEKLFLAKDFTRLRRQNNRIKRELLSQIPKNSIVVDIGSGAGGDIAKFDGRAKIVLSIEPDEVNRNEMIRRIKSMKGLKTEFVIVNCGGEDSNTIIEALTPIIEKNSNLPLCIVSMLSMTFFWKNRSLLDKFEHTLKEVSKKSSNKVRFYFFTVEGNRFKTYFSENDNKIKNYGLLAQYKPDEIKYGVGIKGYVKIQLPGTSTVDRPQREYLVNLDDMKCLKDIKTKEGVIEDYLTMEEYRYARCAVYGSALIQN